MMVENNIHDKNIIYSNKKNYRFFYFFFISKKSSQVKYLTCADTWLEDPKVKFVVSHSLQKHLILGTCELRARVCE